MKRIILIPLILIFTSLSCKKSDVLEEETPSASHFLDSYVGVYHGTMEYKSKNTHYAETLDLECDFSDFWISDTTYTIETLVTLTRDSASILILDDELNNVDRTFEIDSSLSYEHDLADGPDYEKWYRFSIIKGTDSLYIHLDEDGFFNCVDIKEDHYYSLLKSE